MSPSLPAALLLLLGACPPPAQAAPPRNCRAEPVRPSPAPVRAGDFALDLGDADDVKAPTAWEGPIRLTRRSTTCTVSDEVGVIEAPMLSDGRHLLVLTYSGSAATVYAVDMPTCRVGWASKPMDEPAARSLMDRARGGAKLPGWSADCAP